MITAQVSISARAASKVVSAARRAVIAGHGLEFAQIDGHNTVDGHGLDRDRHD
jgi:hypothetical protein